MADSSEFKIATFSHLNSTYNKWIGNSLQAWNKPEQTPQRNPQKYHKYKIYKLALRNELIMIFIFEMPWTFQNFYENTFDTTLCCRATNCSILTRPVPKFIKFSYFIINKTTTFVAKTLRFLIIVIVVTFWNFWVTFWGIDSSIWAAYL